MIVWVFLVGLLFLPAALSAAPSAGARKPDQSSPDQLPVFARQAAPAVVGIRSQIPSHRRSAGTLGDERWGSGIIVDGSGHVLTVSYIVVEAERLDVFLRDGRTVSARLVGVDHESGLGVIKLDGSGPWPQAQLGNSKQAAPGQPAGIVGVDEGRRLVVTQGSVKEIRAFAGYWEYMLDRAFIVEPFNRAFGGSPLLNIAGEVIGVTSLRLGEDPVFNLAIPIELFLAVKDELIAKGRVESRRPRPWLGVSALQGDRGVVVGRVSPVGPASQAGVQRGDLIVELDGGKIERLEEFYARLWQKTAGEEITLVVIREERPHTLRVRTGDRYRFYRSSSP